MRRNCHWHCTKALGGKPFCATTVTVIKICGCTNRRNEKINKDKDKSIYGLYCCKGLVLDVGILCLAKLSECHKEKIRFFCFLCAKFPLFSTPCIMHKDRYKTYTQHKHIMWLVIFIVIDYSSVTKKEECVFCFILCFLLYARYYVLCCVLSVHM